MEDLEERVLLRYIKCVESFSENELNILVNYIGSQLGVKNKDLFLDIKSWLLNNESSLHNRSHTAFFEKRMEVMIAPIENMPLEVNYPHPLIRAIVYWRLEIGK